MKQIGAGHRRALRPGGAGERDPAAHGAEAQQEGGGEDERTRWDAGGGLDTANEGEERGARGERKVESGRGRGSG